MAFALFYNGDDAQRIADCYQAARTSLAAADRQNMDACWNAGLSQWSSAANLVYSAGPPEAWSSYCLHPDGTVDRGLCDQQTHLIAITGVWARNAAAYGATAGQPITKAGFVGLMRRLGAADPDTTRGEWIVSLADDISATAREPYP